MCRTRRIKVCERITSFYSGLPVRTPAHLACHPLSSIGSNKPGCLGSVTKRSRHAISALNHGGYAPDTKTNLIWSSATRQKLRSEEPVKQTARSWHSKPEKSLTARRQRQELRPGQPNRVPKQVPCWRRLCQSMSGQLTISSQTMSWSHHKELNEGISSLLSRSSRPPILLLTSSWPLKHVHLLTLAIE